DGGDYAVHLCVVRVLLESVGGQGIRVLARAATAGILVVRGVDVDVALGVQIPETLCQPLQHGQVHRLEQAGVIGVDEYHPVAGRSFDSSRRMMRCRCAAASPCPPPYLRVLFGEAYWSYDQYATFRDHRRRRRRYT